MSTPDYSKYIKKSFELVKRNKWLWIFGALTGAGGGSSLNYDISKTFGDFKTDQKPQELLETIPDKTANVLGVYTSNLVDWLKSVPPSKWILLAVLLTLLILTGLAVVIIVKNWARGCLIKGVDRADKGEKVDLSNSSPFGFKYLKTLIFLSVRLSLYVLGVAILTPLVWTVVYFIVKNVEILKILWLIIGSLGSVFVVFTGIILLTLMNIYAERLIIIKDMNLRSAWLKAFEMSKKYFFPSLLMGTINMVIGFVVGLGNVIILAIAIGIPGYLTVRFFETNVILSATLGALTSVSLMIFIFFSTVVSSALISFNYSNWNQLFNDYFEKSNEK